MKPQKGCSMNSLANQKQIFTLDDILRKLDGDERDNRDVINAYAQQAIQAARTWAWSSDLSKPWPMTDPDARGKALVGYMLENLCASLHRTAKGEEDVPSTGDNAITTHRVALMQEDIKGTTGFRLAEIQRWLKAVDVEVPAFREVGNASAARTVAEPVKASARKPKSIESLQDIQQLGQEQKGPHSVDEWAPIARRYADDWWLNSRIPATNPKVSEVACKVAALLEKNGISAERGPISAANIERNALRGWKKPAAKPAKAA
jgi:hypothetical protein